MNLPRRYNERLQRFDPLLRMRWSQSQERWLLERKYRRAAWSIAPGTLDEDAYIQVRDGYLFLGSYGPRELPHIDRLILHLGWADTWRHGYSPEQFADAYEQHQDVKEDARQRSVHRQFRDRSSDTYEDAVSLAGARSYGRHTGFR